MGRVCHRDQGRAGGRGREVGACVGETVSPKLVGVDVDGAVDGEFIGGAVSWNEPVCCTTREPTTVAPSKEGVLAILVYPVTVTKLENAAPSEASSSLS